MQGMDVFAKWLHEPLHCCRRTIASSDSACTYSHVKPGGRLHSRIRDKLLPTLSIAHKPHFYSLSESSESPPAAAFLAGFFFLPLLFFLPVFLARGCSRIFRTSSSVIFLSDWTLDRSRAGGPPSLVMPFLVMAGNFVSNVSQVPGLIRRVSGNRRV